MEPNIQHITREVERTSPMMRAVVQEMKKIMVGQDYLLERLLIGLIANGHILIEGVPGLAKTTAVKTLAQTIATSFQRIQFTPDLLPADLIGTQIYLPKSGEFTIKKGPIFSNIILADEINRAPAKVQSALLECMQERQVTIGETTFFLEEPFLVMATQEPIRCPRPRLIVSCSSLKSAIPAKQRKKKLCSALPDARWKRLNPLPRRSKYLRCAALQTRCTLMRSCRIILWKSSVPPASPKCLAST
jgi:hypothetical protein